MKTGHQYNFFIYLFWALIMIICVIVALTNTTLQKNIYYDLQIEASTKTQQAFDEIKAYKLAHSGLSKYDSYECGMIGERYTNITTTTGILQAKKTTCNPNFSALMIDYFRQAGIKKGDEVALVTSGSFPTLNIACIIAIETMGLKVCTMSSIGASSYGANDPEFTYFDMYQYLYEKGIIKSPLDYVSIGGSGDIGKDLEEEDLEPIINRIKASGVNFIYEPDYPTNVRLRKKYIYEKCPNVKLFINVGGSLVSLGVDEAGFINKNGLVNPNYLVHVSENKRDALGLIDLFLESGVSIVQFLNIKSLALKNGILYDPTVIPTIGSGNMYYQTNYNLFFIIIGLIVSVLLMIYFGIEKVKKGKENGKANLLSRGR